ncbi:MAG TPA: L,D-transpeptidase family protein, partial [Thermoanaerobaculia bacterium]|nr:L,D-transpeptidase family protein [Thermoanaerobaculia bacterium]
YFLHGTDNDREIGRAASRGCVRLRNQDMVELAQLVHRYSGPDLAPAEVQGLVTQTRRTRHLTLSRPVPVELVYEVVELRDGTLHVHEDPYRRLAAPIEELAMQALVESGVSAAEVDGEALRSAVTAGTPVAVPIETLLQAAAVASR